MKEYTIDAKGRALGRIASEAAAILRGKNDASFQENIAPDIKLNVLNVDQIKLTGQKSKQKEYKLMLSKLIKTPRLVYFQKWNI